MGGPREAREGWTCGFAGRVPSSADPVCGREASWHGFVLDGEAQHVVSMMSSCDDHLRFMKLTADFTHPHRHPCAIPGSLFRWPENECYTDWDEAGELAAAMESAR